MSHAAPLVSVIMPCWNAAAYLGQAVESVQGQTFTDWELLITDDGSTDDSVSIIRKFLVRDERLRLICQSCNRGVREARNLATAAARGRYIAFLDSDDQWLPHTLARQVAFINQEKTAFICAAGERIDADGRSIDVLCPRPQLRYQDILITNDIMCSTAMYDSWAIGKIYNFHPWGVDDHILWLRILKLCGTMRCQQEVLAVYRYRKGSRSWNKWRAARLQWQTYRLVEGLGFVSSLSCFLRYAVHGLRKHRLPLLHALRH